EMRGLSTDATAGFNLASLNASSASVDWRLIHEAVMNTQPTGHVYYEFLAPLTAYFSVDRRLMKFQTQSGAAFVGLVRKYVERMDGADRLAICCDEWLWTVLAPRIRYHQLVGGSQGGLGRSVALGL